LSRRPHYGSHKTGDRVKALEEIQILKLNQFNYADEFGGCRDDVNDHQIGGANILSQVNYQTLSRHVGLTLNRTNTQVAYTDNDLAQAIKSALPNDPNIGPYLEDLRNDRIPDDEDTRKYLEPFTMEYDLVLYNGLVYIPKDDAIKLCIFQQCDESTTAGHLGQDKTLELITRDYYWLRMRQFLNEYIKFCNTCSRNKMPRHKPHGLLKPLPIPPGLWSSVSMDFIVELHLSDSFDTIYICMDPELAVNLPRPGFGGYV
jgi:Integrase zinc binding domain